MGRGGGVLFIQMPLDYEGVMEGIEAEPNQKTNERFASIDEWIELFNPVAEIFGKLVHSEVVEHDAVLIYKKDSFYEGADKIDEILGEEK